MAYRLGVVCLLVVAMTARSSMQSGSTQKTMPPPPAPKAGMMKPPATDADKIKSAMSAAPMAIAKDAAIVDMNEKMEVRTIRTGTNGWTCIPDSPSPGVDPMCVDANGWLWAEAWLKRQPPPAGKIGIGYMLMGGSDASNTDPFAMTPPAGKPWIDTGPHLMVLNVENHFDGYPTTAANTKVPYVMFSGTPYAHLMIPVK